MQRAVGVAELPGEQLGKAIVVDTYRLPSKSSWGCIPTVVIQLCGDCEDCDNSGVIC